MFDLPRRFFPLKSSINCEKSIAVGRFFHRGCFNQMLTHLSHCPACRHENKLENPRALELPDDLDLAEVDLEEAELQLLVFNDPEGTFFSTMRFQAQVCEEIHELRFRGLPVPHRPGSPFWHILPYFIPEHYFLRICMPLNDLLKSMWAI